MSPKLIINRKDSNIHTQWELELTTQDKNLGIPDQIK